jgi:hypothetical protein
LWRTSWAIPHSVASTSSATGLRQAGFDKLSQRVSNKVNHGFQQLNQRGFDERQRWFSGITGTLKNRK